jgi:hypothetical protein
MTRKGCAMHIVLSQKNFIVLGNGWVEMDGHETGNEQPSGMWLSSTLSGIYAQSQKL